MPVADDAVDAALAAIFEPTQQDHDDPYPAYRVLREAAALHRVPDLGVHIVARHEDVATLLAHRAASTRPDPVTSGIPEDALRFLSRVLLFMDGEEHTRLRKLVNRAFTPRAVERLRSRVAEIADQLLDELVERGEAELLADFAFPLPITVIADMLGVPASDQGAFRAQVPKLTPLLEVNSGPDALERAGEALWFFATYFQPLFEQRRAEPRDDLLSALVHAEVDGDRLDPIDALITAILLLGAGHETTMNLLGNGLLALLRHPDQLALVRDGEVPAIQAVEELLRYDPPVQLTARRFTEAVEVSSGEVIPEGGFAMLLLAGANRDPRVFADPERLDVTRTDVRHLSFGHGPHYCLGAALARLEAEVAFPKLLRRLPGLELAGEVHFRPTTTLRGVTALPLTFRAGVPA